ncbi:MAG TPA: bifunctional pyr operon transcriptional regulator/uracil phosphoribosyltransferase PyrR [Edaphocola sp.]|nr:bifunctional pyr operon transcriptional regulator/uracil phosphoribosyltransferase PyrR [Edaphocola sp.]
MKSLYDSQELDITITRLALQLIENHEGFENTVIIGLQPRGVHLSDRIFQKIQKILPKTRIEYGKLDITFYRDDFNEKGGLLQASDTQLDFPIEGKQIILVDDVLFTGRSIRAGLEALLDYGRPANVELLVLIDRRFNREVPIQPDYSGMAVDVIEDQKVKVLWQEKDGKDEVVLL